MMNVPILGIVENYSYIECPDCGKHINVFGESHIDEVAAELKLPVLGKMPIIPDMARLSDEGAFDKISNDMISEAVKAIAAAESK